MDLIAELPLSVAAEYIDYAIEQEREQAILEQWRRLYPWMAAGLLGFKPYSEFRSEVLKPQIQYSSKSFEEIEAEMAAVVAAYEGR
jgi:hypothetical protein